MIFVFTSLSYLLIVPEAVGVDLRMQTFDLLLRRLNAERVGQRVQLRPDIVEFYFIFIKFDHGFPTLFKIIEEYYTGKQMGCKEAKRLPTRRRRFSASAAADFVFLVPEDQIIQIPVIRKPTKSSVHTLPPFCDPA